MEALAREFRVTLPWELLYADDLIVIAFGLGTCKLAKYVPVNVLVYVKHSI